MFNLKKAAVFGIDARIALVVASIASLAIALNRQSLIESSKLQDISLRILEVEDAMIEDYAQNYKNANFLVKGYSAMSQTEKEEMFQGKNQLLTDPWQNEWEIKTFVDSSGSLTAFGEVIEPVCVVVFSAGADGYHDKASKYTATTYDDCANNVGLDYDETETEKNDDFFYKFTTIAYEVKINQDLVERLDRIRQALYNYSEAAKNIRINYCNGLSQASADADALCDIDISGAYEQAELDNVNFMPKSSVDATAAVYGDATSYDLSTLVGREDFVAELGLPNSYVSDLALRTLQYNSNANSSTTGPFSASFYYKAN